MTDMMDAFATFASSFRHSFLSAISGWKVYPSQLLSIWRFVPDFLHLNPSVLRPTMQLDAKDLLLHVRICRPTDFSSLSFALVTAFYKPPAFYFVQEQFVYTGSRVNTGERRWKGTSLAARTNDVQLIQNSLEPVSEISLGIAAIQPLRTIVHPIEYFRLI